MKKMTEIKTDTITEKLLRDTKIATVWTDTIEASLEEIKQNSRMYKILNLQAMRATKRLHDVLMYLTIILSPIAGIITALSGTDVNRTVVTVFVIVFTFISGGLSSVVKFSKLEERLALHRIFVSKFASLQGNIGRQLSLQRSERADARLYLEIVSKAYEELFANMPIVDISMEHTEGPVGSRSPTEKVLTPRGSGENLPVEQSRNRAPTVSTGEFIIPINDSSHVNDRLAYELARLNRN